MGRSSSHTMVVVLYFASGAFAKFVPEEAESFVRREKNIQRRVASLSVKSSGLETEDTIRRESFWKSTEHLELSIGSNGHVRRQESATPDPLPQANFSRFSAVRTLHENEITLNDLLKKMRHENVLYRENSNPSPCQPLFDHDNAHDITIVTVSTKSSECHPLIGWTPTWGFTATNVGSHKRWGGYRSKVKYMLEWLQQISDDRIVAFIDGGDVLYAGCDKKEFLRRFETLKQATGSKVFFGAERNCYDLAICPFRDNKCPADFNAATTWALSGLGEGHAREASMKAMNITREQLSAEEWSATITPTPRHHEQIFLNSGFVIGRVHDLLRVYKQWDELITGEDCNISNSTDQFYAYEVFKRSNGFVTLDYTGVLVQNLYDLRTSSTKTGKELFHWTGQKLINTETGMDVCFAHGNGPAKLVVWGISDKIHGGPGDYHDPNPLAHAGNVDGKY